MSTFDGGHYHPLHHAGRAVRPDAYDHSGIQVSDIAKARKFYVACFGPLGASQQMEVPTEYTGGRQVVGYGRDKPDFWLSEGEAQVPPLHFAFTAGNRAEVDAFYMAAMAAGGRDNGAPGLRS